MYYIQYTTVYRLLYLNILLHYYIMNGKSAITCAPATVRLFQESSLDRLLNATV